MNEITIFIQKTQSSFQLNRTRTIMFVQLENLIQTSQDKLLIKFLKYIRYIYTEIDESER